MDGDERLTDDVGHSSAAALVVFVVDVEHTERPVVGVGTDRRRSTGEGRLVQRLVDLATDLVHVDEPVHFEDRERVDDVERPAERERDEVDTLEGRAAFVPRPLLRDPP